MKKVILIYLIFLITINGQTVLPDDDTPNNGGCSINYGVNDLFSVDENNLLVIGGNLKKSVVLSSNNSGKTWTKRFESANTYLSEFHFFDKKSGLVVGSEIDNGLLLKTVDGGITWEKTLLEVKDTIESVDFVGKSGWAIGYNGTFLETTDSGETWKISKTNIKNPILIDFRNKFSGWVINQLRDDNYEGDIYQTKDGGKNWVSEKAKFLALLTKYKPLQIKFINLKFTDANTGYLVAQFRKVTGSEEEGNRRIVYFGGVVFTTNNGGDTWQSHVFTTTLGVSNSYIGDKGKLWISPFEDWRENIFFVSSNKGKNCRKQSILPIEGYNRQRIYFLNEKVGWLIVQADMFYDCIFRTVDGGKTWK